MDLGRDCSSAGFVNRVVPAEAVLFTTIREVQKRRLDQVECALRDALGGMVLGRWGMQNSLREIGVHGSPPHPAETRAEPFKRVGGSR